MQIISSKWKVNVEMDERHSQIVERERETGCESGNDSEGSETKKSGMDGMWKVHSLDKQTNTENGDA